MHRKDYILIAKVLRKERIKTEKIGAFAKAAVEDVISSFCSALKLENSSFNEQKFRDYIEKGE